MILVPLLNPKFATVPAEKSCELRVRGTRALRIQLGRVLEMAESSPDRYAYENKIVERFGGQQELELVVPPPPPAAPAAETNEAAKLRRPP